MTLIKSVSGIRGTIGGHPGEGLTPDDIVAFSSAFSQWLHETGRPLKVVTGRDGRISGEMVQQLVNSTLQSMGIDVTDIGLTTTPTIEMAVPAENAGGGIIITASHNPKQWNALKLLNEKGHFVTEADSKKIIKYASDRSYVFVQVEDLGRQSKISTYDDYHIDKILELPLVDKNAIAKRKFRIVIDCVNSTGGLFIPPLLDALGVKDTVELFCAPNGRFPHNPEPLEENLTVLTNQVKFHNADLGIAVDPDVDRLAFVCEDGSFFGEEYTLVAVADYILQHTKGPVVANLSTTRALQKIAEKHNCSYFASAVGEAHVVAKMIEENAVIGGEGNGGVIYPELHYGRDALVGIALFLTFLAKSEKSAKALRASFPEFKMIKKKISLDSKTNLNDILDQVSKKYSSQPQNTVDGLKINFDDNWVHLRKSNTEPIIRIYAESTSQEAATKLADQIIVDINALIKQKA